MSGIYVYCIIPAADRQPFELAGICPANPSVRTISGGRLAAVVGAAPDVDLRVLAREDAIHYLLAHQRVVEAVMRKSAALPVKFGTILPDEETVMDLLVRAEPVLSPPLSELAEHVQIELIVSWSLDDVLREIAAEDAIVALKAKVATEPPGSAADLRVELGRLVKAAIDRRREACRTPILDALRPIVVDVAQNALMDDRMVANVALLMLETVSEAFDQCLADLDAKYDGRLNFRSIGPLPPYSFATVEVTLPSFEAIDRARRALSLGETAARTEIKSAYRRLIRAVHPDISAASADAEAAATLTDAYRTLMRYSEALPAPAVASRESGCRFDRDAVDHAIMVAVRRQDLAVAEARP